MGAGWFQYGTSPPSTFGRDHGRGLWQICHSRLGRRAGRGRIGCGRSSLCGGIPWRRGVGPGDGTAEVTISEMRRQSYRLARDLGNVQAASRGPASYSKRVLRRNVYRHTMGLTRKVTKGFGL